MNKSAKIKNLGICIKNEDGIIEFQNDLCVNLCDERIGKKCRDGCMQSYKTEKTARSAVFSQKIKVVKNINLGKNSFDAVLIDDGINLITIQCESDNIVKKQLNIVKEYNLTKTELMVVDKLFRGHTNSKIAQELFISKKTLRTHLNNIYKKIPIDLKNKILAIYSRNGT